MPSLLDEATLLVTADYRLESDSGELAQTGVNEPQLAQN